MTENEEILNELKQISPYLVSISKENVLTVPANYFDVLPEQLLNYIATEKLIFDDKTQLFNVPSGYFEGTQFISRLPSTGEVFKVTYDQETLTRLKTALKNVATEHGFGPVEPQTLLRTILGLGEEGLYIPGPSFRSRQVQ